MLLQYHFKQTELVTTRKRQATELPSDIERDKEPILITQNVLPAAYRADVESYELLEQRMTVLDGIASGELAIAEGRTLPHERAKAWIARWQNSLR